MEAVKRRLMDIGEANLNLAIREAGRCKRWSEVARFMEQHVRQAGFSVVEQFVDSTEPAEYDQERLRALLRTGISQDAISGSADTLVAVLDALDSDERSAT